MAGVDAQAFGSVARWLRNVTSFPADEQAAWI
jgi:hypothetical protein